MATATPSSSAEPSKRTSSRRSAAAGPLSSTVKRVIVLLAVVCGCFQVLLVRKHNHYLLPQKHDLGLTPHVKLFDAFYDEADRRHRERRRRVGRREGVSYAAVTKDGKVSVIQKDVSAEKLPRRHLLSSDFL